MLEVASQSLVDGVTTLYQGYGKPLARVPIPIPRTWRLPSAVGAVWALSRRSSIGSR